MKNFKTSKFQKFKTLKFQNFKFQNFQNTIYTHHSTFNASLFLRAQVWFQNRRAKERKNTNKPPHLFHPSFYPGGMLNPNSLFSQFPMVPGSGGFGGGFGSRFGQIPPMSAHQAAAILADPRNQGMLQAAQAAQAAQSISRAANNSDDPSAAASITAALAAARLNLSLPYFPAFPMEPASRPRLHNNVSTGGMLLLTDDQQRERLRQMQQQQQQQHQQHQQQYNQWCVKHLMALFPMSGGGQVVAPAATVANAGRFSLASYQQQLLNSLMTPPRPPSVNDGNSGSGGGASKPNEQGDTSTSPRSL